MFTVPVQPVLDVVVSVTLYVPGPVKMCDGFCSVEVLFGAEAGSPKSHDHAVIVPVAAVEVSVNCVADPTQTFVFENPAVTCGNVLMVVEAEEHPVAVVTTTE